MIIRINSIIFVDFFAYIYTDSSSFLTPMYIRLPGTQKKQPSDCPRGLKFESFFNFIIAHIELIGLIVYYEYFGLRPVSVMFMDKVVTAARYHFEDELAFNIFIVVVRLDSGLRKISK